jgi:hypothetical protein
MKSRAICFTLLSAIAISIAASLPAQAQRARVFVSVTGDDANPCTAGSPCKTFQAAHDAVLAGGEISVLDSGGYGTLKINKALSIVAIGVEASIAIGSGQNGITINAGSNDAISLRGLTLDGTGVGLTGIVFNSGRSLTVDGCVVRNMAFDDIDFMSNATTVQAFAVSNSYFNDNGGTGIVISTGGSGAITASVERTGFYGNVNGGFEVDGDFGAGAITVSVVDSVAANKGFGFLASAAANHSVTNVSLTHSQAASNSIGIAAQGANATLWLAQSTVTGNAVGFETNSGGRINSYGDNYLQAANTLNSGTLGTASRQ